MGAGGDRAGAGDGWHSGSGRAHNTLPLFLGTVSTSLRGYDDLVPSMFEISSVRLSGPRPGSPTIFNTQSGISIILDAYSFGSL